jgi:hypothetical protein
MLYSQKVDFCSGDLLRSGSALFARTQASIFFTTPGHLYKIKKKSKGLQSGTGFAAQSSASSGSQQKTWRRKLMRMPVRSPAIPPLAVAAAAIWLWGAGSAWAGGASDAGTLQSFLTSVCGSLSIPTASCPQLPTVTQGVLEIAGLAYARPESIRAAALIPPGSVYAGNSPPIPANPVVPVVLPVTPLAFSNLTLTPLAFITTSTYQGHAAPAKGHATPTQLYDPDADSFFSAVTTFGSVQGAPQPQMLNLFYDDLARSNHAFTNGQIVAEFSLPLVVYNSNACAANPLGCTERPVMTTLEIKSCANGRADCFMANATGDFLGNLTRQTRLAADVGVNFAFVFGPSPISTHPHAIFEVQVPLVVTAANDPVYFSFSSPQDLIIGSPTFSPEDVGFTPTKVGILPPNASIGIAPYPAPMTVPNATTANYGFCANLPDNSNGPGAHLHPAVAAFLAVATDGETLVSTPLGESSMPTLQCPF